MYRTTRAFTSFTYLAALALAVAPVAVLSACKKNQEISGAVGANVQAFITWDCAAGGRNCFVCQYSGKPKMMVFTDHEGEKLEQDLLKVDAFVKKHAGKGLATFAVVGAQKNGKLTSFPDEQSAIARFKDLHQKLGLGFPLTTLPTQLTDDETKTYRRFEDAYALTGPRVVLLANSSGVIVHAESIQEGQEDAQFQKLEEALSKVL